MAYLELFNGRTDPNQEMQDWGVEGPVFGPYPWFHTTYQCEIQFGESGLLKIQDDLIYYDGIFYGDWLIFDDLIGAYASSRLKKFDPELARLPTQNGSPSNSETL
ncbi:MAG: hypothetical protein KDA65_16335 [Planctomycetaceae bacterium]|nr:hypothetical protein [Planctomycetaceae bacterium]